MDNKLSIEKISNKLFALKAKIYENSKEDLLHASGHACQEDLKLMLRLINPRFLMPVHGDFRMLKSYSFLAQELGIPSQNILICENGEVVESFDKKFFLSQEKISAYPDYVFNNRLVLAKELEENLILRKKMAVGGVVLVMIFYQEKNNLFELPYIFTYGFINMEKNRNLINS
jgi:ribonuclease J